VVWFGFVLRGVVRGSGVVEVCYYYFTRFNRLAVVDLKKENQVSRTEHVSARGCVDTPWWLHMAQGFVGSGEDAISLPRDVTRVLGNLEKRNTITFPRRYIKAICHL
jgi:hypothetical protein